jgi:hypothetical protein
MAADVQFNVEVMKQQIVVAGSLVRERVGTPQHARRFICHAIFTIPQRGIRNIWLSDVKVTFKWLLSGFMVGSSFSYCALGT